MFEPLTIIFPGAEHMAKRYHGALGDCNDGAGAGE
jgi:hypothetical protein